MSEAIKFVDDLPEWFRLASPEACVNIGELHKIIGLTPGQIRWLITKKMFPLPDYVNKYALYGVKDIPVRKKHSWKVSTIRKLCQRGKYGTHEN